MDRDSYLVFVIDGRRFAMPCECVVHVAAAAELLEIPEAPTCVRGVANLGGEPVPVTDIRRRPNASFPEMELSDRFIFFRRRTHLCGLLADSVEGVESLAPGTAPLSLPSTHGEDREERTVLVAYEPGAEQGILIRSPDDLSPLTDRELQSIDRVVSSAGASS